MSDQSKIPLPGSLQEIVGSLLFASETPMTPGDLRSAIKSLESEEGENRETMEVYRTCTGREIEAALKGLGKALEVASCGFELVCTGGAYRLQTAAPCGRYVRAMLKLDKPGRLGRASLETLAIIAYRQPVTKSEIEEIRGVDVSGNVKTLLDLQLIRLVGKSELPGHPFLYGTTALFLEHFGLSSLQQLNEIDPTLQRSNPREKAAMYKKPASPQPELPANPETPGEPENPAAPEDAEDADKQEDSGEAEVPEGAENPAATETAGGDDDIFIDDTPDEFDDEDDDEDDEEGEEEDDEDED